MKAYRLLISVLATLCLLMGSSPSIASAEETNDGNSQQNGIWIEALTCSRLTVGAGPLESRATVEVVIRHISKNQNVWSSSVSVAPNSFASLDLPMTGYSRSNYLVSISFYSSSVTSGDSRIIECGEGEEPVPGPKAQIRINSFTCSSLTYTITEGRYPFGDFFIDVHTQGLETNFGPGQVPYPGPGTYTVDLVLPTTADSYWTRIGDRVEVEGVNAHGTTNGCSQRGSDTDELVRELVALLIRILEDILANTR